MPGRRRKPEGVGTKVEDSLVRHHYLPVVRALRLPGAAALLPDLTPAGFVALLDAARQQGERDALMRLNRTI